MELYTLANRSTKVSFGVEVICVFATLIYWFIPGNHLILCYLMTGASVLTLFGCGTSFCFTKKFKNLITVVNTKINYYRNIEIELNELNNGISSFLENQYKNERDNDFFISIE